MLRPIKLPRCFRLLTTYSPNEAMPAKFNGDADSGDRDDRHAPVQGDDDAPRVDPVSVVRDDEHAPVQDDDFIPAVGVQGDGGAPVQDDGHAPVADDDFVPADGEPRPNRRRIELPPQHPLQRRNCEDPLNVPDEEDEEATQSANESQ